MGLARLGTISWIQYCMMPRNLNYLPSVNASQQRPQCTTFVNFGLSSKHESICSFKISHLELEFLPSPIISTNIKHTVGKLTMSSPHLTQLRKWMLESPPVEWGIDQVRELLIGALRHGPIPQHVAFVMDGNRRFARNHRMETVEGHNLGFEALARVCTHDSIIIGTLLIL
jgi:hypothetical protein